MQASIPAKTYVISGAAETKSKSAIVLSLSCGNERVGPADGSGMSLTLFPVGRKQGNYRLELFGRMVSLRTFLMRTCALLLCTHYLVMFLPCFAFNRPAGPAARHHPAARHGQPAEPQAVGRDLPGRRRVSVARESAENLSQKYEEGSALNGCL